MKKLFYILFCFSLLGCSDPAPKKPANLIGQAKMVQLLADIHMVEAQVERAILYPDTALMAFNHHQQEVLAKHGVSEKDFRDTYRYYLRNLTELDKVYEVVIDTLSIREIKASKEASEETAVVAEENIPQPAVVPDSAAVTAAPAVAPDTTATAAPVAPATDQEVRQPATWLDIWKCRLYQFQLQPYLVSTSKTTLPYYLSPTIHNLPHACLGPQ